MALFNSTSWTGRNPPASGAATAVVETVEKSRHEHAPKKLLPRPETGLMAETAIAEYRKVAAEIGISDQDMLVEEFRLYLAKADIPTFNLQEVVAYMDELTARDNPTKLGWHWCPVRAKDTETALHFGRPSTRQQYASFGSSSEREREDIPASDYYASHRFAEYNQNVRWERQGGQAPSPTDWRNMPSAAYSRTLPLHAIKKIAKIEREFTAGKPIFLVTDYTVTPHIVINPDPFLMAVIPNSAVAHGKGRFIIDVWDEPGFGLDRMLK